MRTLILFMGAAFACTPASAQFETKYTALTVPDSLRKNANAVVREDYTRFRIKDVDEAIMESHSIVTILNEKGSGYLDFVNYSDKFHQLDEAEVKVYNAFGKKINSYSKKEMQSFAYGDGLVDDGKVTYFSVNAATYPITIEQTSRVKYKGLLDYPDMLIQEPEISKEHFLCIVETPAALDVRYKTLNSALQPKKNTDGNTLIYTWEVSDIKAMKRELHSGPSDRYFPKVIISPTRFKIGGYEGDMSSWKGFGMWSYNLIGKGNQLSDKSKAVIVSLVKDAATDEEKARIVYKYLQQNMRYVSVQLGIGGWKPFDADFVQDKKYGDCKALSNYMQAALSAVGVKSYYAIVNAGTNAMPAQEDFPASVFNHVILCIPQKKDSIWLECTSNTSDFGQLGDFTENRKALLVTEKGGVLVSTPKSRAAENMYSCKTSVTLLPDGDGTMATSISGTGEFKREQVNYLSQRSSDEQVKYFIKDIEWKHPDKCAITPGSRAATPFRIDAAMEYGQLYVFKSGSKMFLPLRYYPLFNERINDNTERAQDFFFEHPYIKTDTTIFHLPEGFVLENLPKERSISNGFAKYDSHYSYDAAGRNITLIARLEITQQLIQVADYQRLVSFRKEVDADMNQRLVVKTP